MADLVVREDVVARMVDQLGISVRQMRIEGRVLRAEPTAYRSPVAAHAEESIRLQQARVESIAAQLEHLMEGVLAATVALGEQDRLIAARPGWYR